MERFLYFLFALGILYACSSDSLLGDIEVSDTKKILLKEKNSELASSASASINCVHHE